jgi:hypothetical protein
MRGEGLIGMDILDHFINPLHLLAEFPRIASPIEGTPLKKIRNEKK